MDSPNSCPIFLLNDSLYFLLRLKLDVVAAARLACVNRRLRDLNPPTASRATRFSTSYTASIRRIIDFTTSSGVDAIAWQLEALDNQTESSFQVVYVKPLQHPHIDFRDLDDKVFANLSGTMYTACVIEDYGRVPGRSRRRGLKRGCNRDTILEKMQSLEKHVQRHMPGVWTLELVVYQLEGMVKQRVSIDKLPHLPLQWFSVENEDEQ